MTIKECKDRQKLYKNMLDNLEAIKLTLLRSIAIEQINIKDLKEKAKKEKLNE